MIFIFSIPKDRTTFKVCSWLDHYAVPYTLVFPEDILEIENIVLNSSKIEIIFMLNTTRFLLSNITGIWYRRGYVPLRFEYSESSIVEINQHIKLEHNVIGNFIANKFNSLPNINKIGQGNTNKLLALDNAVKCGLNIPSTMITKEINDCFYLGKNIITKSIGESLLINNSTGSSFYNETTIVQKDNIDIDRRYNYSLFQVEIQKQIELRIFHFFGKNYSMAIFSQENEKTKTDFRNYDIENPNRNIPYKIPKEVEHKINIFMELMDINSGSLDMIKTPNGEFIFLEVNPVGQYDMVSYPCNYFLHRLIAEKLKYFNETSNQKCFQ